MYDNIIITYIKLLHFKCNNQIISEDPCYCLLTCHKKLNTQKRGLVYIT